MELRHLRYFVGVAEALSFTKAAEKLHTAQPSLTRQIKDLEEELGVRLLNRTKQQVTLTDEGRSFLVDAKRVLALAAETVESVRRLRSGETRALNVGYVSNLFYDLLPNTLSSFHQSFPTVSVNLFDLSCGEQFRALEDGKLDLGFVGLHEAIARRGLEFRSIASYKTVAALPKDNPMVSHPTVELKALASMFFIGMSEMSYPGYRDWLTKTCRRAAFTPKVLQDVDLERTMIHAVAAGLGVALVPEQLKKLEHDNVVFRPLNPTVATEGCVAWRSENTSAALQAYVRIVEQLGRSIR
ncbi:MAG TPA: LysR substrate-binding domain-containing protein [Chthoniobacterales bacterium]|jgi:DNA-binding transcriptional LysR family regulator|nr:LysR substrate-binding domain-containing protein [Chthoniobacterales bacterium]